MTHFGGKEPLEHLEEKRAETARFQAEIHGENLPSNILFCAEATYETAFLLCLLWILLGPLSLKFSAFLLIMALSAIGIIVWKSIRSALIGWNKLERLHKLIEQEKYEIEHHRGDEKEELRALYQAKGFEGKLLDDVVEVLMADQDRLLKVMLEEELGLTLEAFEHPLKQAVGTLFGSLCAAMISIGAFILFPSFGTPLACFLIIGGISLWTAYLEKGNIIARVVWGLASAFVALGIVYEIVSFSWH